MTTMVIFFFLNDGVISSSALVPSLRVFHSYQCCTNQVEGIESARLPFDGKVRWDPYWRGNAINI